MKRLLATLLLILAALAMAGCWDECPYGAGSSGTCRPGPVGE